MSTPRSARPDGDSLASMVAVELSDEQLEHLADLVALRLQATAMPAASDDDSERVQEHEPVLVAAAELARRLGVSRWWIYEHSHELGVVRLGEGKPPPLFDDSVRSRGSAVGELVGSGLATCGFVHRRFHAHETGFMGWRCDRANRGRGAVNRRR